MREEKKSVAAVELSWATGVAVVLSTVTIGLALISIPFICQQVADIRRELALEMSEYRGLSDELWSEMLRLGKNDQPSNRRQARDAYGAAYDNAAAAADSGASSANAAPPIVEPQLPLPIVEEEEQIIEPPPKCNCQAEENRCPIGPPGPPGQPGASGEDGAAGQAGQDGGDAGDVQEMAQSFAECFRCPAGPVGVPGPPGRAGAKGMRGARGQAGCAGRNGSPGPPGAPGEMGARGSAGQSGPQGDVGEAGNSYRHLPGPKGAPGPIGEEGDPGRPGNDGKDGDEGEVGPQGPRGQPGETGPRGPEGAPGERGGHGSDARYCPCPQRSKFLGTESATGYGNEEAPPEAPKTEVEINEGYGIAAADHHQGGESHEEEKEAGEPIDDGYGQAPMLQPSIEPNAGTEEPPMTTTGATVGIVRDAEGEAYGAAKAPPPPPPPPAKEELFVPVPDSYGAADIGRPELEKKVLNRAKVISKGGKPQRPRMVPISAYGRYRNRKA